MQLYYHPCSSNFRRVLEKLGFKREGVMPQRWFVHGEFSDTAFYGLLRQDWKG